MHSVTKDASVEEEKEKTLYKAHLGEENLGTPGIPSTASQKPSLIQILQMKKILQEPLEISHSGP